VLYTLSAADMSAKCDCGGSLVSPGWGHRSTAPRIVVRTAVVHVHAFDNAVVDRAAALDNPPAHLGFEIGVKPPVRYVWSPPHTTWWLDYCSCYVLIGP
jgi:hypothetical protein